MFEEIEKRRGHSKLFTVLGVFVLLAAVAGVAVAAWTWTYVSPNTNTIGTGNISMTLLESTDVINIQNALPTTDETGEGLPSSKSFAFAVTTSASGAPGTINYTIYVTKLAATSGYTRLADNQVKIYLENTTDGTVARASTLMSGLSAYTTGGATDSYILATGSHVHATTGVTTTTNYSLKMWIDYNVDASDWDENTKLEYKLKIGVSGSLTAA